MADDICGLVSKLESKVKERTKELEIINSKLKYISYHDPVTGLYNRMYFENEIIKVDRPENLPICVIYGDVNGLKLANDIFGHVAGDKLLIKLAEILKKVCRKDDIIARIGGDEFAIILPKTIEIDAVNITDDCQGKG